MEQNPMYQALLRWSLSQNDGTTSTEGVKEMDKEKKEFLERVMSEMVEDEAATMTELVARMKGPQGSEEEVEAVENAMEELGDRVDRIDYAMTLHIYGQGFLPIFDIIKDTAHDSIRQRAADLASICLRNNEKCQQWAFEYGAVETLLNAYKNPDHGETSRVRVLGSLSALIQNHAAAEERFLAGDGIRAVKADVQGIGRKLKIKALFMLQWLLGSSAAARKAAVQCSMGDALSSCCVDDDDEVVEYAAMALCGLLQEGKDVVQSAEKLVEVLEQRLNTGTIGTNESEAAAHNLKQCISMLKAEPSAGARNASTAVAIVNK